MIFLPKYTLIVIFFPQSYVFYISFYSSMILAKLVYEFVAQQNVNIQLQSATKRLFVVISLRVFQTTNCSIVFFFFFRFCLKFDILDQR